jgi:hypothetical protein
MRQVREVLRLKDRRGRAQRDCPPSRCCAVDCPVDLKATGKCRVRLAVAGRDDRQCAGDGAVRCRRCQGHRRRAEPDWAVIHYELKRKHVTLAIPM